MRYQVLLAEMRPHPATGELLPRGDAPGPADAPQVPDVVTDPLVTFAEERFGNRSCEHRPNWWNTPAARALEAGK